MESLIELVGKPVDAKAVQAVVVADSLRASSDPPGYCGDSEETRRLYFSSHSGGYELIHVGGCVQTVFLYLRADDDFQPFPGPLLAGLTPADDRAAVRVRLGKPTFSGDATDILGLERQGPWDRWDNEQFCIHFQYTEADETLRLITVMSASSAP